MTGSVFIGRENSGLYRSYPFAEGAAVEDSDGVALATDVFVDAFLYPVMPEPAPLYLSRISPRYGVVEVSCGDEGGETVVLHGSANAESGSIELYDLNGRHGGVLVCGYGWGREFKAMRERSFAPGSAAFSSFVMSPIPYSGVESVVFAEGQNGRTHGRRLVFRGDGAITPVLKASDSGATLYFDASYSTSERTDAPPPVRQLVFAVEGRTVFDVQKQSDDTVLLTTPQLDREDLCWQAHQEDSVVNVVDTCAPDPSSPSGSCPSERITNKSGAVFVCPSSIGNINIVADDALGLKNSAKTTTVAGELTPNTPSFKSGMNSDDIIEEGTKAVSRQTDIGNGLVISMPGLSNGR